MKSPGPVGGRLVERCRGGQIGRVDRGANSCQAEAVGIKAAPDRGVFVWRPAGVAFTGIGKPHKLVSADRGQLAGQVGCARAMVGVIVLVESPGVVEQAEEDEDLAVGPRRGLRETQRGRGDRSPMTITVERAFRQRGTFPDRAYEFLIGFQHRCGDPLT